MLHPKIRIPLWAAVALPAAAYGIRSVMRGFDFGPDMPVDAIVFGLLGVLIFVSAVSRRSSSTDNSDGSLAREMEQEHDPTGSTRNEQ